MNTAALSPDVLATAEVFRVPLVHPFRGVRAREGVVLRGSAGWAEFAPFRDYSDAQCVPWLRAALASAGTAWPAPLRDAVDVNAIVPAVHPDLAAAIVRAAGCRTVKVKVAQPGSDPADDVRRVAAVRAELGPGGRIRVDANGAWTVDEAERAIRALGTAAGGLEYVEQPCRTLPELAEVRRRTGVRVAADESVRLAADPGAVPLAGLVDAVVLKVPPLGGVLQTLRVAAALGVPAVVSSAVDSSIGLAAGLAAAAALPRLPYACGLDTGRLLAADVTSDPVRAERGSMAVRAAAPEPDLLAECRADPPTRRWWFARLTRVAALLAAAEPTAG